MMAYYRIVPTVGACCSCRCHPRADRVFTAAVALLLAMANLFYRDVKYLFEVVITVWMFATSVLYPVNRVGGWSARCCGSTR